LPPPFASATPPARRPGAAYNISQQEESDIARATERSQQDALVYQQHVDRLVKRASARGLQVDDVAGDGNCLFRALAYWAYDDVARHAQVRAEVVKWMESHTNTADQSAVLSEFDGCVDWQDYCRRVATDTAWGGQLELMNAARYYCVQIVVLSSLERAERPVVHEPYQQSTAVWTLGHIHELHYVVLRPVCLRACFMRRCYDRRLIVSPP
jgi:hypothetical protein